jgi:paraquat-inducible protein B
MAFAFFCSAVVTFQPVTAQAKLDPAACEAKRSDIAAQISDLQSEMSKLNQLMSIIKSTGAKLDSEQSRVVLESSLTNVNQATNILKPKSDAVRSALARYEATCT